MAGVAKHAGRVHPVRLIGWSLVAAILSAPLVAMQFTREVAWTASDFAFAGVLLIGGGLLIELAVRRVVNRAAMTAICAAVVLAVLLIWADGAVGIF